MCSHSVMDQKLQVLYDKYNDFDFAASAQKEIEDIRRSALLKGAVISGAIFVANEAVRLTMRSRMLLSSTLNPNKNIALFKLKLHNTAFWLIAPTIASKYYYDCHIH